MKRRDDDLERWIEEQVVLYLAESRTGKRVSPEGFVAALEAPPLHDVERDGLLQRLRYVGQIEGFLAPDAEGEFAPGFELDDFVIEGYLGHGGMGQVFRGRQKSIGRAVAIKTPLWAGRLDPRERARFRREAQAVGQLRHPAIVSLYQVGEHRGTPYLVMELAEGVSLAERLSELKAGRLPRSGESLGLDGESYERAVARLALQVLEGLEAAHAEGIVHRDLKPSNLVLAPDGRVRILDFGLARRSVEDSLTLSGELLGTPDYLAPELVRNPRAASPASDVYACGVLLYELLAFEKPFRASSTQLLLARILEGDPPPLRTRIRVARPLSAIVEKAMAGDPGRRYPSAAAVADDLHAFLDGREVTARPSGPLTRMGRRLQRRPALTAISALAFVVAVTLGSVWQRLNVVQAATDTREARQLFVKALLDQHRDDATMGGPTTRTAGRELAIEDLKRALDLAPSFFEARLHLAVLEVELGRTETSRRELERIRADETAHRAVFWLEEASERPGNEFLRPTDAISTKWPQLSSIDRYYAARAMQRSPEDQPLAAEIARSLRTDPLYAAPAMVLEAISITVRGAGDHLNAARLYQAALVLAPDHPILIANQAQALAVISTRRAKADDQAMSFGQDGLPLELRDALENCKRVLADEPDVQVLWLNYSNALGHAGLHERVVTEILPVLDRFPDYPQLARNWLNGVMMQVMSGEDVSPELLKTAATQATGLLEGDESNRQHHILAAVVLGGLGDGEAVQAHLDRIVELGGPEPGWQEAFDALHRWLLEEAKGK